MKTAIDDWRFKAAEEGLLLADVYLANGQQALLEVNPLINPKQPAEPVPEIILFCEMPGERISGGSGPGRWISRPPNRSCPWSCVEIPPALNEQIRARLTAMLSVTHAPTATVPVVAEAVPSASAN